jgi:hypothetical protein
LPTAQTPSSLKVVGSSQVFNPTQKEIRFMRSLLITIFAVLIGLGSLTTVHGQGRVLKVYKQPT